jgi:hypothetical protein
MDQTHVREITAICVLRPVWPSRPLDRQESPYEIRLLAESVRLTIKQEFQIHCPILPSQLLCGSSLSQRMGVWH